MKRVVVVGAGISGMAAALRVLEQEPEAMVTVLDAADRPGGALQTERTDDGFVIERGPDSILTSKPAALEMSESLGITDRVVRTREENRGAYVVCRGKLERIPPGFQLLAPSALLSFWKSPVLSPAGKLRSALELVLPRGRKRSDESLRSFVERRFGGEMLDRLAQPMVGGIYGSLPERLSLRATMPRFPEMEDAERSVTLGLMKAARKGAAKASGARYGLFISFDGGVAVLPEAMAEKLGDRVQLGCPVTGLERRGTEWRVRGGEATYHADALVLAVSAWRTAALMAEIDPRLSAHLRAVRYGSAATVTMAWDRGDVPHALDASGFVVPAVEPGLILASTWASEKWPGRAPEGKVLLRVFVGGNDHDEVVRYEDRTLRGIARRGLRDLMGIEAEPLLTRIDRYDRMMPRYELDHVQRMNAVDALMLGHPTLALCGSAYRGVGIPDSIASGWRAAERILAA